MIERVRPESEPSLSNESRVHGRPFQRGNPGRPPGSKNKITRLLEQLGENEAENLIRKMIELAKSGNVPCLQYCLDRLWPQRRGQPINLDLPKINGVQDIAPAMAAVTHAVSNGAVTPEEGFQVARLLDSNANAIIASDFAVRLEKVESVIEMKGKKGGADQRTKR
jgi:hypothetical protein